MCVICVARVCARSSHTNVASPPFRSALIKECPISDQFLQTVVAQKSRIGAHLTEWCGVQIGHKVVKLGGWRAQTLERN